MSIATEARSIKWIKPMKLLFSISLLLLFQKMMAQDCSCAAQLNFVTNYFEQNNPAFQKIKNDPASYTRYKADLKQLRNLANKEKDTDLCIRILDKYVTLLKDHHSGIGFNLNRKDLGDSSRVAAFKSSSAYRKFKKIQVDTTALYKRLGKKDITAIEGIYSDGRSIVFGIMQKEKNPNQYIGVVLKTNKLLDAGHILLELTRQRDSSFDVYYNIGLLGFNFQRIIKNMRIEHGQIPFLGFSKGSVPASLGKNYEFKELNDSTNYLRLLSFDARLTRELDSFYRSIDQVIRSKPYLIIDIRNNGGGSESSYFNLLPYAYTRPLHIDTASVWVTPENIKRYEEATTGDYKDLVARMKKAVPYRFIPQAETAQYTWAMDSVTVYPNKIALLFNRGTASAGEGMIQYFIQSDKVMTIGENSGGYIGYGNVMNAPVPCGKFTVQSTTTRYLQKSKYEFVGIAPMYRVKQSDDWISFAQEVLSRESGVRSK
jgi:hypothetical protein